MNGEIASSSKEVDGGTSQSDQEALVDVPLSFELSGFETLSNINRGICNIHLLSLLPDALDVSVPGLL